MPKVSVVVPTYNRPQYVGQTIESILSQTFQDFEIVVVDDGSTEETRQVLAPYADRIKYFYQANQGLCAARNFGFKQTSGEYVAFLDDDDLWLPHTLEKLLEVMIKNPELAFVCADTYLIDPEGNIDRIKDEIGGLNSTFNDLYEKWFVQILAVLMRRSCLEKVGLFDEGVYLSECYDLFLRLAKRYPFHYIHEPLAKYRIHPTNASKDLETIIRARRKVINKKEITEGMSKFRKITRTARMYHKFAGMYYYRKNYLKAGINYSRAVATYPFVGMYYRPSKNNFKSVLPYRIMKVYWQIVESFVKAFISNGHLAKTK